MLMLNSTQTYRQTLLPVSYHICILKFSIYKDKLVFHIKGKYDSIWGCDSLLLTEQTGLSHLCWEVDQLRQPDSISFVAFKEVQ